MNVFYNGMQFDLPLVIEAVSIGQSRSSVRSKLSRAASARAASIKPDDEIDHGGKD